jgi:ABC-type multidrug transport system ATPase subunit
VVIATHHADEARALCQRVAVLEGARLAALVSPDRAIERLVADG